MSTAAQSSFRFGILDYWVFSVVLFVTAVIGFYYAWIDRKKKTLDNVLLGDRKLSVRPDNYL